MSRFDDIQARHAKATRADEDQPKVWFCKIGEVARDDLPKGSDLPMRDAVAVRYERITGREPDFIFSGWDAMLDEGERAVVEDRLPDPALVGASPDDVGWLLDRVTRLETALTQIAERKRGTVTTSASEPVFVDGEERSAVYVRGRSPEEIARAALDTEQPCSHPDCGRGKHDDGFHQFDR